MRAVGLVLARPRGVTYVWLGRSIMGENDFKVGEKVAWTYMGKDVPGVVKDKSEGEIVAHSGGKDIKRNGEPGNPGYVLEMDKGDSKDGKEVAKKGSNLHSRESGGDGEDGDKTQGSGDGAAGAEKEGKESGEGGKNGAEGGAEAGEVDAAHAAGEDAKGVDEKAMAADEDAAGGKEEEEALEAALEKADAAAEEGGTEEPGEEEGVLKRKPLEAATTRGDTTKVAKMGGPASNLRSNS
eukprot:jgi/Ulvmu1/6614/UM003_0251.1